MNKHFRHRLICFVLLLSALSPLRSQEHILVPEDIVRIKMVQSPSISPDGTKIIFVVGRHREEEPGNPINDLWIVGADDGSPRRFSWGDYNDWAPSWSPDGVWIAFLSNRDGSTQLYRIPADGGEAERLTSTQSGIRSFQWSPDGSAIAFTSQDPVPSPAVEARSSGQDWIVADENMRSIRLYSLNPENRLTTLVSRYELSVWHFAWSPDGSSFMLTATDLPTVDAAFYGDLYTIDSRGGNAELFARAPGKTGRVLWSPDGRNVAVQNARAEGKEPIEGGILIYSIAGEEGRSILEDFPGTVTDFGWMTNNELYFVAQQDTRVTLNTVDIRNRRVTRIIDNAVVFTAIDVSSDRRYFAMAANTVSHPNEVWRGAFREREILKLTSLNHELGNIALGEVSEVSWLGPGDVTIQGVLIKPVGYREGTRYPLILQIHGGPEAAYLRGWHGSWSMWGQMLAGAGYAVLLPNYRGSTSRGVDFITSNMGDMMGAEWEDILAGADRMIELGIADRQRIGIGGWSYGGYTSAWASATASDRIRAAIMGAGISNWISFGGMTDIPDEMARAHWNGYTWDNKELQWERSPLKFIDRAAAPTLILFGEKDERVPPGQGWELYNALKYYEVSTDFVLYPRAGHGITEREHQLDLMRRVLGWFDRYVK